MTEWTLEEFSEKLFSKDSVPGGGGAAALSGANGCALGGMVANLTIGKKKYADFEEELISLRGEAEQLMNELLSDVENDAAAFRPLSAAYGLPKETEEQRAYKDEVLEKALYEASLVPVHTMEKALAMIDIHARLAQIGSRLAVSDIGVGVSLCRSAVLGASMNVTTNTRMMKNRERADMLDQRAEEMVKEAEEKADAVYETVQNRLKG